MGIRIKYTLLHLTLLILFNLLVEVIKVVRVTFLLKNILYNKFIIKSVYLKLYFLAKIGFPFSIFTISRF